MLGATRGHRRVASKSSDPFQDVEEDAGPVERDPTGRYLRYPAILGRGACKCVFQAFDTETGMEVAWNQVQVAGAEMERGTMDKLSEEIRVLQKLYHKNIMTLYHSWYNARQSTLNFITELFHSGTLRQYRKKVPHRINESILKRWAWQILEGLVYLHGHDPPIVHRDLKCDNIFINANVGQIKIGDLGLATCQQGLSVVGTPEFMAPEIYEEQYDHKVDIYSFGMCLLELATQKYPYSECQRVAQIFKRVTTGVQPEAVKLMTGQLREVIEICIAHEPTERPEARVLLKHPFFESLRKEQELANAKSSFTSNQSRTDMDRSAQVSQVSTCSMTTDEPATPVGLRSAAGDPAAGVSATPRAPSMTRAGRNEARVNGPAAGGSGRDAPQQHRHMDSHPLDLEASDTSDAEDKGSLDAAAAAKAVAAAMGHDHDSDDDGSDDGMSDSSEEIIIPIDYLADEMEEDQCDECGNESSGAFGMSSGAGSPFVSTPRSGQLVGDLSAFDASSPSDPTKLEARVASNRAMSASLAQSFSTGPMRSRPSLRQPSGLMSQLRISDLFGRSSDPNAKPGPRVGKTRSPANGVSEAGEGGSPACTGTGSDAAAAAASQQEEVMEDGAGPSKLRCTSYGPMMQDRSRPICGIIIRVKARHKGRVLGRLLSKERAMAAGTFEQPTGTTRIQSI